MVSRPFVHRVTPTDWLGSRRLRLITQVVSQWITLGCVEAVNLRCVLFLVLVLRHPLVTDNSAGDLLLLLPNAVELFGGRSLKLIGVRGEVEVCRLRVTSLIWLALTTRGTVTDSRLPVGPLVGSQLCRPQHQRGWPA